MLPEERLKSIELGINEIKLLLNRLLNKQDEGDTETDRSYLNVKEAAKLLGVAPSLIYSKCISGDLPHIRVGKYYKFRKNELMQWMQQSKLGGIDVEDYVNTYLQKNILKG